MKGLFFSLILAASQTVFSSPFITSSSVASLLSPYGNKSYDDRVLKVDQSTGDSLLYLFSVLNSNLVFKIYAATTKSCPEGSYYNVETRRCRRYYYNSGAEYPLRLDHPLGPDQTVFIGYPALFTLSISSLIYILSALLSSKLKNFNYKFLLKIKLKAQTLFLKIKKVRPP